MAQPTPYVPTYNFTDWQTAHPSDPLPADEVDIQLNLIKTFSQKVCTNLALIQRDDGALANNSVGIDQLSSELDFGFATLTTWVTAHAYVPRDGVYFGANVYRCIVAHTSDTFATDLAAGKWVLVANFQQFIDTATTQAGIATTQAGIATTQAGISTTQAGISTTQAGVATAAAAQAVAAASGVKTRGSARASTTGVLPNTPTYNNGTAGVGATLTAGANAALAAQDGVTLLLNDILLVQNQASAFQNGLYTVTALGSGAAPWVLTRLPSMDTWAEVPGSSIAIEEGTNWGDHNLLCTANAGGTMGVTAITWQDFVAVLLDNSVITSKIAGANVTNVKLANMAANTVKANATAGSAAPTDFALAASTLFGRGNSGNIAAITLENGLAFNGGVLARRDGYVATTTTPYVQTAADDIIDIDASGGAKAVTMLTASSYPGKRVEIRKSGADTTFNVITITGITTLNTSGEVVVLESNGAVWFVYQRYIPSQWTAYTPAVAVSSGSITNVAHSGFWRREGDSIRCRTQTTFSGASAAFGNYYVSQPTGLTIATTKLPSQTVQQLLGMAYVVDGGVQTYPGVVSYDTTGRVQIMVENAAATNVTSATSTLSNTAPITYGTGDNIMADFVVPIVGWNA